MSASDEQLVDVVMSLLDDGATLAEAILAAVELEEATTPAHGGFACDPPPTEGTP